MYPRKLSFFNIWEKMWLGIAMNLGELEWFSERWPNKLVLSAG